MPKSKLFLSAVLLLIIAATASGCVTIKTEGDAAGSGTDGGVFKTANRGDSWQQKALIPTTSGKPSSIAGLSAVCLSMDPSDNKAIYYGSQLNGLFYSYDGADSWQVAKTLGQVTVNDAVVDPSSKCVIYASAANRIYKSTDCSRAWSQIYYDNDLTVTVNSIAIDYYDSKNIYAGTSRGEVIKSSDRGESWQTVNRLKNNVEKIMISPFDSRIIFAATAKKGIHRSLDSGYNWTDLSANLKEFKDGMTYRDLVISKSEEGLIFLANSYGLLKSADYGDTWANITLITPEKEATINAIAVSPKNAKEIYYVTNTTFYRSDDGGETWTTKKLPTSWAGRKLLIDPEEPNIIYMGVKLIKK
ncbi:hypothetical protein KJ586_01625 [Patescibacteria group bacterium]|nr:hypothetical protein [Patescibacteria group bacterium]MBU4347076.1 hypothetical protein [Patescibacteria group bacterium]MBU4455192.1 hypothetical protein [Patescibacteria group bacterium]MCG2690461.1 hypothetical protein [Candidatus Parcubacteria bacterium]